MKLLLGQTEVSGLMCGFFVAQIGDNTEMERSEPESERFFVIQFACRVCAKKTTGFKRFYGCIDEMFRLCFHQNNNA
jgi:hypothetical protein